MKENRAVSTITHPVRVNDWVWVKRSTDPKRPGCPVSGPARVANNDLAGLMVEFPTAHPRLHDGNGFVEGKANRCWFVLEDDLAPLPMEFCVFRDGDTTYCLRGDKRNVTGKAQFSAAESAEFDPLVGAIIAMARAYGRNPTEVAYKVLTALSAAPQPVKTVAAAGLEKRLADAEFSIDQLYDLVFDLDKRVQSLEAFQPYPDPGHAKKQPVKELVIKAKGLVNRRYGVVGTRTPYFTDDGIELHVGDRVILESKDHQKDWVETRFNTLMVETEDGIFPLGILGDCDPKTGRVKGWKISLHPDQLKVGQSMDVGPCELVIEEEEV